MIKIKVSPKFQVVIPEKIRKEFNIKAGERLQPFPYENRIELIPIKPIKSMRGFLKGIKTNVKREKDRL